MDTETALNLRIDYQKGVIARQHKEIAQLKQSCAEQKIGGIGEFVEKFNVEYGGGVGEALEEYSAIYCEELAKANERVKGLEQNLNESDDDLGVTQQQLSRCENTLEEVKAVFVDNDACPFFEPFNASNLSNWLNKFTLQQRIKSVSELSTYFVNRANREEEMLPIYFPDWCNDFREQLRKGQDDA